jgi:signal transduction histidine kinase/DNA-binding NarL/FixJ family response regulator
VLAAGAYWLFQVALQRHSIYRIQAALILMAIPIPLLLNLIYIAGLSPFGADYTTTGLVVSGLLLLAAMLRYQLFDLVPVAREQLLDEINSAVLLLDGELRVIEANQAAAALFWSGDPDGAGFIGTPAVQALGSWPDLLEILPPARAEISGQPGLAESASHFLNQADRTYEVRIKPVSAAAVPSHGWLMILYDITQLKASEAELSQQKSTLAVLEERDRMGRELHDSLGQMLNYVNMESRLVFDYLEKNDISTAAGHLARLMEVAQDANIDVREFIREARAGFSADTGFFPALEAYIQRFSRYTGLPVVLSLPEDKLDALLSTAVKLQALRIIQEALSNIHKHADAHSAQVIFSHQSDQITVVISDDGRGFDPSQLPEGEHFGLEIMAGRARDIGGDLQIRSAPGQGTQLLLSLPVIAESEVQALMELKFLLVDDHPLILEGVSNLLAARQILVVGTASNGTEAVELARQLQPDMVLMDVQMPGLSGPEATGQIKSFLPEARVVMLTMSMNQADLRESLARGASGYLLKNQDPEAFLHSLGRIAQGETIIDADATRQALHQAATQAESADKTPAPEIPPEIYLLSARQVDILQRIVDGESYKEIGAALQISPYTVKYHFNQIQQHLNVNSRGEAIQMAIEAGIIRGRRAKDSRW